MEDFAAIEISDSPSGRRRRPLKIVSYATSLNDGSAPVLARDINLHTPNYARCVAPQNKDSNPAGVIPDLDAHRSPATSVAELASCDVILMQLGSSDPAHCHLIANKPVVTTPPGNTNTSDGFAGQWQAYWEPAITKGRSQAHHA